MILNWAHSYRETGSNTTQSSRMTYQEAAALISDIALSALLASATTLTFLAIKGFSLGPLNALAKLNLPGLLILASSTSAIITINILLIKKHYTPVLSSSITPNDQIVKLESKISDLESKNKNLQNEFSKECDAKIEATITHINSENQKKNECFERRLKEEYQRREKEMSARHKQERHCIRQELKQQINSLEEELKKSKENEEVLSNEIDLLKKNQNKDIN